ncbi:CGNR zinc finger domain-containing protein [Leclercia sp.]|uniref:CGNR zinc finger domain-containing protein n=1 Tax=Leclercia sp. TaxID=1898428 RepID=UPI00265AE3CA|nr:CGNR zinc finger domain-containing protein [Leclercia sp.]MCG1031066.1 CGNR zinc finger domain-containing protein [Bacillus amyloliquefaciens]
MTDTASNTNRGPWFLAEQIALDFINTVAMTDKEAQDFLQTDDDVFRWLNSAGIEIQASRNAQPGKLLLSARTLRELIRSLVEKKKKGHQFDPDGLNEYLKKIVSYPKIITDSEGTCQIVRCFETALPAHALGVVAEEAAKLLTEGNFDYVRQCEHPDCTLWFYDRTKAHKRRWCSMALCGNRIKIAKFRQKAAAGKS